MACFVSAGSDPSTGPSSTMPGRDGRGSVTSSPASPLRPRPPPPPPPLGPHTPLQQHAPLLFQRPRLFRRGLHHIRVGRAAPPLLLGRDQLGRPPAREQRIHVGDNNVPHRLLRAADVPQIGDVSRVVGGFHFTPREE